MNWFRSARRRDDNAHAREAQEREDDDMCARAVVAVINSRRNRRRDPHPMHDSQLTGSMRVEEILNGHDDVIQALISMRSSTFRSLSNLLGGRGMLKQTNHMNVNEQLFIFLTICSQGATNRHVSYLFQHSPETTSRWFFRVLKAICALKDEYIRPPDYTTVQPLIIEHTGKYRPWFDVRYHCLIFENSYYVGPCTIDNSVFTKVCGWIFVLACRVALGQLMGHTSHVSLGARMLMDGLTGKDYTRKIY